MIFRDQPQRMRKPIHEKKNANKISSPILVMLSMIIRNSYKNVDFENFKLEQLYQIKHLFVFVLRKIRFQN